MPISFSCPSCAAPLHAAESLAGKASKCTTCGETLRVPMATPVAAPKPEPIALKRPAPVVEKPAAPPPPAAAPAPVMTREISPWESVFSGALLASLACTLVGACLTEAAVLGLALACFAMAVADLCGGLWRRIFGRVLCVVFALVCFLEIVGPALESMQQRTRSLAPRERSVRVEQD